jgi:hypothetical protein
VDLYATREIGRPAEVVFDFVSDSSNNPKWQRGQRSCVWTSPSPHGLGSVYEQEARFLGRTVLTRFQVVDYDPGRAITIESLESSFPIRVRRSVEPLGPDRSRVTAEISGEPGGFFGMVGPVLRRLAQRSVDADYDRLVKLLEAE